MKIKLTSVYVDDQDKALRFYTEVLGFARKSDSSQGPFRWLTVASAEEANGTELQLALNNNPAAKTYQQAIFEQGQPAAMFFTDDVKADYERIKARGAEFHDAAHRRDRLDHCDAEGYLRQPHSAHPANTLLNAAVPHIGAATIHTTVKGDRVKRMTTREQYTPGPPRGAQVRKDGEKWTLILVRELHHAPEKVWLALTDPAHLREWAPFEADGGLATVGAPSVNLTWSLQRADHR